ncbi:glycosyltransferase family 2 protein [Chryseobacterium caseinilyticum]|uniref:Glycosyltransferase family 2 protein n=1 Tax=Chryseobacterium caseinilyticum TaxID=2771428 RepID=A0ABR8ZAR2_9FLAO|nr:glycosyltransferase family 2 protein [Chryseobacterium caseinilyticum]MBD8082323.1 glycosyltransferase family 2 protein [Chryseobacterium caseinilyticum]
MAYQIIDQTPDGTPDICISMLTYNHGKYITDALQGILSQNTAYSYKIVLADDFSTDNTRQLLLEFQKKHPSLIKLILQDKNVGAAGNNSVLHEHIEGKYVAALEGDDYWTEPDKLQKQVDFLEKNQEYSMCFHNVTEKFEDFKTERAFDHLEQREYTSTELVNGWVVPTVSVVYRKFPDLFIKDDRILFGDISLFLQLSKHGRMFCFVTQRPMAVYRRFQGSATNKAYNVDYIKRLLRHNEFLNDHFGTEIMSTIRKNSFELNFILFYKIFPKRESFVFLKKSFRNSDNFLWDVLLFFYRNLRRKFSS